MSDDFYQRMADRAQQRAEQNRAATKAYDDLEWQRYWADIERKAMAMRAGMTLGEAVQRLSAPSAICACIGPPHCCRYGYIQAEALHRGAHIVAKLLAEATR